MLSDRDKIIFLAEKVMGWECLPGSDENGLWIRDQQSGNIRAFWNPNASGINIWNPLENIAQTFEVVEAVRAQHFFQIDSIGEVGMDWHCRIGWEDVFEAQNEKLPRAICDAAIEAYGGMPDAR